MTNERRKSQRLAVMMTVDLLLAGVSGKTLAGPVNVEMNTLSLRGGSVVLPSMQVNGMHLFYACNDREGCFLMLRFEDNSDRSYMIFCRPAWFDKERDEASAYYKMGFEFSRVEDRDNIKRLARLARGKSEKKRFRILGDLFTKS